MKIHHPKYNRKTIVAFFVIVFLILNAIQLVAQNSITLQDLLVMAKQNNLQVKNEKLKTEYLQQIIKTAKAIPATNIGLDLGQMNSAYFDNRIYASQNIPLPQTYRSQQHLFTEEWKQSALIVARKEAELDKAVSSSFYQLVYLIEKEKILLQSDATYTEFVRTATLRFSKGESNLLEKITAETQRGNIKVQLQQLQQEKKIWQLQLQLLLNTEMEIIPNYDAYKLNATLNTNNEGIAQHPILQSIQQQLAVSKASIAIEKSKLLPELSVGFSSTTMRGIGANDITYNGLSRFQSAQIGAAIPLFTKAQKEKIKAATMYEGIFVQLYQAQKQELDNQYQSLAMQYVTYLQNVNYYEQEALPNAKTINFIADKQFLNGEINYLEWVMLTNQAIEIQNNYIESVKQLNDILIQINYITPIGIGAK